MEGELQRNRRSLYEEQVSILPRWFTGEMLCLPASSAAIGACDGVPPTRDLK
jgi:hypothetical protein